MTTFLLVVNTARPAAVSLGESARAWLGEQGHTVLSWEEAEGKLDEVDVAVSLGGDGTLLRTVHLTLEHAIPVFGVNLGQMGYLAEVEPAGVEAALRRIIEGEFIVEDRMLLDVEVRAGGVTARQHALNEVVVEKTAPAHTIRVAVVIAGREFLTYVADGLLVCTPTGSTAYNLSARGPVLAPNLHAMVLTPIAPHLVFDRSLVLHPADVVEMTLLEGQSAVAVTDGDGAIELAPGDVVRCGQADDYARLITFGRLDFHGVLRSRFGIAGR